MRGWGLLAIVAAAACNPNGLTLEVVVDDPGIKTVQLFVGQHCDQDCPAGTIPPGLTAMTVDDAFVVTDPDPFTVVDSDFTDGVAGFRIEAAQDTRLGILVVVGFDGQGAPKWSHTFHDVDVPHGSAAHWRVELEPTIPIGPVSQAPAQGTERIAIWQEPSMQRPACVLVEHWTDNATPTRDLLGPKGDLDCDDVAAMYECAPWIPNAVGATPTIDSANCVTHGLENAISVCVLGGPQCTEDPNGSRQACVPLDHTYCIPSGFCYCAGMADPAPCLRTVFAEGTSATSTMPFLRCMIPVDASGNRCDEQALQIDGGAYLTNGRNCSSIGLADAESPVGPFQPYIALGNAKLKLTNFVEPCKVDVYWDPGVAPLLTYAVLDLALDNGNHLAIPARIDVKPGCVIGASAFCELSTNGANDTIFACVQAATAATCLPSGSCAGPQCGGGCCGAGEMCTNGQCTCGGNAPCTGGNTCQSGVVTEDGCGSVCCGATGPCPI